MGIYFIFSSFEHIYLSYKEKILLVLKIMLNLIRSLVEIRYSLSFISVSEYIKILYFIKNYLLKSIFDNYSQLIKYKVFFYKSILTVIILKYFNFKS